MLNDHESHQSLNTVIHSYEARRVSIQIPIDTPNFRSFHKQQQKFTLKSLVEKGRVSEQERNTDIHNPGTEVV